MSNIQGYPTMVVSKTTKSPGIAVALTLFFGPLGMLYSTILGFFVMVIPYAIIGVVTFGFGLLVLNPICAIWAGVAASMYNKKLVAEANASVPAQNPGMIAPVYVPPPPVQTSSPQPPAMPSGAPVMTPSPENEFHKTSYADQTLLTAQQVLNDAIPDVVMLKTFNFENEAQALRVLVNLKQKIYFLQMQMTSVLDLCDAGMRSTYEKICGEWDCRYSPLSDELMRISSLSEKQKAQPSTWTKVDALAGPQASQRFSAFYAKRLQVQAMVTKIAIACIVAVGLSIGSICAVPFIKDFMAKRELVRLTEAAILAQDWEEAAIRIQGQHTGKESEKLQEKLNTALYEATAKNVEEALAAQDFPAVVRHLRDASRWGKIVDHAKEAANRNEVVAQSIMGFIYGDGIGVPENLAEAAKWYRRAADQEYALAQTILGLMFVDGDDVKRDCKEAMRWLHKAIAQDYAPARFFLGEMYAAGECVGQDDDEALKWFRKAAEQGFARAQYRIGTMYYYGTGVKRDDAEAVKWLRKAAEQGIDPAQFLLGEIYLNGRGVEQDVEEAVKWFRKAAEQGNDFAQDRLDEMGAYDETMQGER